MNHMLYLQHFENINCMSMWYSLCVVQIRKKRMNWIEIEKSTEVPMACLRSTNFYTGNDTGWLPQSHYHLAF